MGEKILFVDRDGTLIREPADFQVDRLDKVELMPQVIPALLRLAGHGYRFVIVTNQDGLGTDAFPQAAFDACHEHALALFASQGVTFEQIFICPHLPAEGCDCRKPRAGLLTGYLATTAVDTLASAVVGDRETDLELADRLGLKGFRVGGDKPWPAIADELCSQGRRGRVERQTNETAIRVAVDLDTPRPIRIRSGIGFYDHMLEQVAEHGGFSLQLECDGDLDVDEHHSVEDSAICIGAAIREALGDKRGIERFGFLLPMDESEARVSLDLSGRALSRFDGDFPRERVGGLPTELVPHFFQSLADALGATLHVAVRGRNAHHMIEACFKSLGRALRQAIRREGNDLPTTKGVLG